MHKARKPAASRKRKSSSNEEHGSSKLPKRDLTGDEGFLPLIAGASGLYNVTYIKAVYCTRTAGKRMQPAKPPLRVFLNCFQFEIALHSVEEFTHANVLFLAFRYCGCYEIASILLVTLAAVPYLISVQWINGKSNRANHFSNINIFVVETLSLCSLKILTWLIHLVKTSGYPAYNFQSLTIFFFRVAVG